MNKCNYCGVELQTEDETKPGFAKEKDNKICTRCFRIKHYNEYETIDLKNEDIKPLIKEINKSKELVLITVDILTLTNGIDFFINEIKNDKILIINKLDAMPKSIKPERIREYIIRTTKYDFKDIVLVSSKNGLNLKELNKSINKYKKTNKVYIVGLTNSGKSTLINRIIKDLGDNNHVLTTSMLPSTTLSSLEIKINSNLTIIDTPGLIDKSSITNLVENTLLKKLENKKPIKERTYQLQNNMYLDIELGLAISPVESANITVYMPNQIEMKKIYKNNFEHYNKEKYSLNNEDIVVPGLGFVSVKGKTDIYIYTNIRTKIEIRKTIF